MGRPDLVLPHYSYFETLAGLNESSPEWGATSAGLVTLRLFDAWVNEGPRVVASDSWSLRAVRDSISAIDARNSVRALLTSIVDAMEHARVVRISTVVPRLMAYARALQFDAKWPLAADVYRTILSHIAPMDDADVVIAANMQLGLCLRTLAQWDEALIAYTTASQIATLTGDVMNVLKSRISEAAVAMDRGNLPSAESILDETIEGAQLAGLLELRALAVHARSNVARRRKDFDRAIQLAYEALGGMREQFARDRVLADLATTFFEIGLHSAARDANLILAATAQEQYTRWVATINLLEIAAMDRMEPIFEQYRRELATSDLPARLAAYYYYYVGQGYRMFERPVQARAALERAMDIAAQHQVNEILFKAEQSLEELEHGSAVTVEDTPEPSPIASEVATAIREIRTLAGVAG
jgi:tetratricopeptide (TPR) repeat protein